MAWTLILALQTLETGAVSAEKVQATHLMTRDIDRMVQERSKTIERFRAVMKMPMSVVFHYRIEYAGKPDQKEQIEIQKELQSAIAALSYVAFAEPNYLASLDGKVPEPGYVVGEILIGLKREDEKAFPQKPVEVDVYSFEVKIACEKEAVLECWAGEPGKGLLVERREGKMESSRVFLVERGIAEKHGSLTFRIQAAGSKEWTVLSLPKEKFPK